MPLVTHLRDEPVDLARCIGLFVARVYSDRLPKVSFPVIDHVADDSVAYGGSTASQRPSRLAVSAVCGLAPSHAPRQAVFAVTKGALAGAIVGSIVGTAILAFLAAWLLLRKSKRKSKRGGFQRYEREEEYHSAAAISKNNQSLSDAESENLLLSNRSQLSKYIPDPADDESVVGRVLGVFDQVSLRVDKFYSHAQPVASPAAETASIAQFDTPYLPGSLSELLEENPKTRRTTITHTLVHLLLLAIQPHNATRGSLLPPLFTFGPLTSDEQATYIWRMLTAYLSRHATSSAAEETQYQQETAVDAFVENFTASFAPYADPLHSPEDHARHLRSVTGAAADLGRWLFGQPCGFDFVYTEEKEGEVVVLPRIVKVFDEKGRRLATKATLCQAVTAGF